MGADHASSTGLRGTAPHTCAASAARRLLALLLVLEGAAHSTVMDRQTLRDWVHRYNTDCLAGLYNQHGGGPLQLPSSVQEAEIADWVRQGPDLAEHGVVCWRRTDLARVIATRFGVVLAERSVGAPLHRLGFRRPVARPLLPVHDAGAQASFRRTSLLS